MATTPNRKTASLSVGPDPDPVPARPSFTPFERAVLERLDTQTRIMGIITSRLTWVVIVVGLTLPLVTVALVRLAAQYPMFPGK